MPSGNQNLPLESPLTKEQMEKIRAAIRNLPSLRVVLDSGHEVNRIIERNPTVPNTPRREKGYRPRVEMLGMYANKHTLGAKSYSIGPLFQTEAEAREWTPPMWSDGVTIMTLEQVMSIDSR